MSNECFEVRQNPRGCKGCGQLVACTRCPKLHVGTEVTQEWHSTGTALNLFIFLSKLLQTLLISLYSDYTDFMK